MSRDTWEQPDSVAGYTLSTSREDYLGSITQPDVDAAAAYLAAMKAEADALRELFLVVSIATVRGTIPDVRAELWQRLVEARAAVDALLQAGAGGSG